MSQIADKMFLIWCMGLGGLFVVVFSAHGFEFVSVAETAILYDAPSIKANKLYIATRYLPLEQIVVLDNWCKVRDSSGKLLWIEKRALGNQRFVTVSIPYAAVYMSSDKNSEVLFQGAQHLALELLENAGNGWLRVRHMDGTTGYIRSSEVWGD